MIPTRRFRRPTGDDRYAVVSVEPSSAQPGTWLIRVARGIAPGSLSSGTVYGPYPTNVADARAEDVVKALLGEGFTPSVHEELIEALSSSDPARRARAASALGWRRERAVVPALLAAAAGKGTELPSIVEALGRIGDPAAIPIARELASKKLLSRRRAGVEALRLLGDAEGLAEARAAGQKRLPPSVAQAIGALDENDLRKSNVAPLLEVIDALEKARIGIVADQLYEAGTPALVATARRMLRTSDVSAPHVWRYAKSVLKRAMLREDATTFALIAHAIEQRARTTKGKSASLKSGLDGETRATRVFGRKTQRWAMRACWRYLRRIAKWRPERYAEIAAEVLCAYRPEDRAPDQGLLGPLAHSYELQRILFARSKRVVLDDRTLKTRFASAAAKLAAATVREEAYPELWDVRPDAYLRVLVGGRLREVQDFALAGVARHPGLAQRLEGDEIATLLGLDHEGVVAVALAELERRFDATKPDLGLLSRLLDSESASVRARGAALLDRSRHAWAGDAEGVLRLLERERPVARTEIAGIVANALRDVSRDARIAIAKRLAERLREGGDDDRLAPIAELLASALRDEVAGVLSSTELIAWIDRGGNAAKRVAGRLLAGRPEALALIGLPRLTALADSEVATVREAAVALLDAAEGELHVDPTPLYTLAESRWDDVRRPALARLRVLITVEQHGLDALIALCDSNHAEVQALGRELVIANFERLDADAVLFRLIEHPQRAMRAFAIELATQHLRPGYVPLARCEAFFRTVLLEVRADADTKRRAIDFLVTRGQVDAQQGALAASLLDRVLRTRTVRDFERVIAGLAAIQTRFPEVRSALSTEGA
ncbi:HEAT repeat domain-containing protein [Sandaracinus amylolyticus]|uniref:HEAT repeat domain-containing protein n=1 Tax=Sandaracinus amylolyticus TaxID=927083 RepID=UPI001F1EEAE0|nr:HEAT repeat domain-containing protein [Sandaracinus amylolyticus]UJR80648.1 Hypothetical protein I5071_26970 [Sandaracinus amylolyticus]